jgi:hypothetical protein
VFPLPGLCYRGKPRVLGLPGLGLLDCLVGLVRLASRSVSASKRLAYARATVMQGQQATSRDRITPDTAMPTRSFRSVRDKRFSCQEVMIDSGSTEDGLEPVFAVR